MSPEQEAQIALIMKLRAEYSDKMLARRFQCSVKTLYRAYRRVIIRELTRNESPPTEAQGA